MTFEEYKKLPKWNGKIFMQDEETCFNDGFEAGAKENGLQWHDLKKDPNDLPKEDGCYLVKIDINENCKYEVDSFYVDDCFVLHGKYVMAWCEIPV